MRMTLIVHSLRGRKIASVLFKCRERPGRKRKRQSQGQKVRVEERASRKLNDAPPGCCVPIEVIFNMSLVSLSRFDGVVGYHVRLTVVITRGLRFEPGSNHFFLFSFEKIRRAETGYALVSRESFV